MPSGISGDMLLTGLAVLSNLNQNDLLESLESIGLPDLKACLQIQNVSVNQISGWRSYVSLPEEAVHRTFSNIKHLIEKSKMTAKAKSFAQSAFLLLAEAEGTIHGVSPEDVRFHEIGALDSILDICLSSLLFDRLSPDLFVCSPIPVCDGTVQCHHGRLATPTPAVLQILSGIPVYGVDSSGETATPTGVALLKAFGATFGTWPAMRVDRVIRAYGSKILPNIPNGAIFALGTSS